MITKEQWAALDAHVNAELEHADRLELSRDQLFEMFGITPPFWEEMQRFARDSDCKYAGDKVGFTTTDGEPLALLFTHRKPGQGSEKF